MMMYRKVAAACFGVFVGTAFVGLSTLVGTSEPAWAQEACPQSKMPPVALPATKKRLASNGEVTIVALGSSSTEGWMATAPSKTYPARLQQDLSNAFPLAHIAVINRGIGGQDALEEVARLDTDVLAIRPDMVIWQVGANGAMAHSDPNVFRKLVSTGIERLKSLGIDVVLMDNQRSPMILASPQHGIMEQILAELSVKYNVSLFSRGALMDGLAARRNALSRFPGQRLGSHERFRLSLCRRLACRGHRIWLGTDPGTDLGRTRRRLTRA